MTTVRELSTRFSFDVDPQGIAKFNRTLGGMKRQVLAVGAALGVGLGFRSLVRFGESLERARFQAGRFSEAIRLTGKFIPDTQKKLDELRKTLGAGAFTDAQAFDAFASFANAAEDFPSLQGKFAEFFEFAVLLNKAGQLKNLGGVVTQMVDSLRTGDPAFLEALPKFSDIAGAKIRKLSQIMQQAFFLPVSQRPQFIKQITEAMAELREELEETAIRAKDTGPGALGNALTELEQAAQKTGASILKFITPAIQGLTELLQLTQGEGDSFPVLEKMGRLLGLIPDRAKSGKEAIDSLIAALRALGIAAGVGIVAGLVVGLPPIIGAAIGLAGGVGFLKLKNLIEDPDFSFAELLLGPLEKAFEDLGQLFTTLVVDPIANAIEDLKELFNDVIEPFNNLIPNLNEPGSFLPEGLQPRERELKLTPLRPGETSRTPVSATSQTRVNIQMNITGSNPDEIGRIVVAKLTEAIGRASIEFTPIEGVEGLT